MNTEEFNPIITVKDLQLAYGEHLVLQDVSFDIKQGTCLVVMGGSGRAPQQPKVRGAEGSTPPPQGAIGGSRPPTPTRPTHTPHNTPPASPVAPTAYP